MPKMKTHRGAAKRFKTTGSGKITHAHTFLSHYREQKSSRRLRRLTGRSEVNSADLKNVKRLLGQ